MQRPNKKQKQHNSTTPNYKLYLDSVEEWTEEEVASLLLRVCSPKVVSDLKDENKLFNGEVLLYIAQFGRKIAEDTLESSPSDERLKDIYDWITITIRPKLFTLFSPEETMKVLVASKCLFGLNRELYVKYFFPKLDGRYLGLISQSLRLNGKERTLLSLLEEFNLDTNEELMRIITWVEQNNYITTQYFPTLSHLLNLMEKLNEIPPPYRFVKFDMKYVERKQALESYFSNLDALLARSSDPKEKGANVVFIGGSPGVGKSRFAYELSKCIEKRYCEEKPNLKMINLVTWFSNGGNFTRCELDGNKPIDLMRSIVARIVYSYIVHVNRHCWLIDIPINKNISTNSELISSIFITLGYVYKREKNNNWFVDVFQWIERNEKEEGKNLWIHFTIDEYNQLIRSLPSQPSVDEQHSIYNECLELLSEVPFCLKSYFSKLLSGTHMQSCKNMISAASRVFLKRIDLSNFEEGEQDQIYCNQEFPNSVTHKFLFKSLGGHARLIGEFGEHVALPTNMILQNIGQVIVSQDRGSIMIGLEESISVLETIISLCITSVPMNIDRPLDRSNPSSSLRILQRSMILFFKETNQVVSNVIVSIPLMVLYLLVSHIRRKDENHFLAKFPKEFNGWENLESFNSHFLNIREKCFELLNNKGIKGY